MDFTLKKIPSVSNPADILTKHVPRKVLEQHLITMNVVEDHGRAASAPTINHADQEKIQSILSNVATRAHRSRRGGVRKREGL